MRPPAYLTCGSAVGTGGFDDAFSAVGASFLNQGLFPWRDFTFIYGLWFDAWRANLSSAIFGDTMWVADAATFVLLIPLCFVMLYLFAAWVSRANPWLCAIVAVAAPVISRPFRPVSRFGSTSRRWAGALSSRSVASQPIP